LEEADVELVIALVVLAVLVVLLLANPLIPRAGDAANAELHAAARGADAQHQFKRRRNEGDLL
jgi:hypothetical protein